jgi:cytidylate kinase
LLKIAIDGPSGAGKSSVSKLLARRFGLTYIDTGAMYRAAGLFCLRAGLNIRENPEAAAGLVEGAAILLENAPDGTQRVLLNGEDVSEAIRAPEASLAASDVSAILAVRKRLVRLQQKMAAERGVVMDGRDIGTRVLPDADVKIFLTAAPEARAKRRCDELAAKGGNVSYQEVLDDMRRRDANDSSRAHDPLRPAEDAVLLDATDCDLAEAVRRAERIVLEKVKCTNL